MKTIYKPSLLHGIFSTALFLVILGSGCLDVDILNIGPCAFPLRCGQPGTLLASLGLSVVEISDRYGRLVYLSDLGGGARGMTFEETSEGLKLYVAVSPHGIYVQDAYESNPRDGVNYTTLLTPGCTIQGIALVGPQNLVGACRPENSLAHINLATGEVSIFYEAPVSTNGESSFDPWAVAFDGNSTVLTGLNEIFAVDILTGESHGVVVPSGFQGASQFRDIAFGPDGQIYVSANPNVGILVLDPRDYSLQRTLVPGGVATMPKLGPMVFSKDGELFIMSGESTHDGVAVVEIDTIKGNVVRTVFEDSEGCCTPGFPTGFLVIRP